MLSLLTGVTTSRAAGRADVRRRPIVLLVGFLGAGAPAGAANSAAGSPPVSLLAIGTAGRVRRRLRADLTMVPITLGTMMAIGAIGKERSGRFRARCQEHSSPRWSRCSRRGGCSVRCGTKRRQH